MIHAPSEARLPPGVALQITGLTKVYDRATTGRRWRPLLPWVEQQPAQPHKVLDSFDLTVRRGESVGIIGPNGAGKSTILKLVAGVTHSDSGTITRSGRVGALIELGAGFHPELTGKENVVCAAILRTHSIADAEAALPEIAAFAGLEDAMDVPLKRYSLGMQGRLAFALATHFPLDVLVIDEVLAVGDPAFQLRCLERIDEMIASGAALVFVSHEMRLVGMVCDRVLHLDEGTVVDEGSPPEVIARFLQQAPPERRATDGNVTIHSLSLPARGVPGDRLTIDLEVETKHPLVQPRIGLEMRLPTLNPDLTFAIATNRFEVLRVPGRYAIHGVSTPIEYQNIDFRFGVSISDGAHIRAVAEAPSRFGGDRRSWSYLTIRPQWSTRPTTISSTPTPASWTGSTDVESAAVVVRGLRKTYALDRMKAPWRWAVPGRFGEGAGKRVALDDVDLVIGRGESVGIIGANGAGKSTLLRIIGGLTAADSGTVTTSGRVVPMLDLGGGMHPELTGRENAGVRAQILGVTRTELASTLESMIEYSGLGDAIDVPVRQYSSGMLARLGFGVAIHCPGDVILIDELLAVGDEAFRQGAMRSIEERRAAGDTIVFVSHELELIEQTCRRAIQLDRGRIVADGPVTQVTDAYGGQQWAGGVLDATSGIRLLDLEVAQRSITVGGTLRASGKLVVEAPAPHAVLEVSYRAVPEDRQGPLSLDDRYLASFYLATLEDAGGVLSQRGAHQFELTLPGNQVTGNFDLVIAAVDPQTKTVLAETWQEVLVGHENTNQMPGFVTTMSWTAERIGDPAP